MSWAHIYHNVLSFFCHPSKFEFWVFFTSMLHYFLFKKGQYQIESLCDRSLYKVCSDVLDMNIPSFSNCVHVIGTRGAAVWLTCNWSNLQAGKFLNSLLSHLTLINSLCIYVFLVLMWRMDCLWDAAHWTLRPALTPVWPDRPISLTASGGNLSSTALTPTLTFHPKVPPETPPLPVTCKSTSWNC